MEQDTNQLNHSTWECKYHVVFRPKYRKNGISQVSPKVIFAKKEQSWAILGWEEDFCGGDVLNVSQRGDGYSPRTSGVD